MMEEEHEQCVPVTEDARDIANLKSTEVPEEIFIVNK